MHRWRAATGSCHVLLVACMLLLVAVPWAVRAQGLAPKDQGRVASAPASFVSVTQLFRSSRSFRNAVRTPKRNACTSGRGSLCGSDGSSIELEALRLAASPQTFDARSDFAGLQVLSPVKNQANCNICVVFSVLAAAQTAAAVALRKSFNGSSWSEQDFFFCLTAGRSEVVTCRGAFTLLGGINTFIAQQKTKKLPVLEACLPYAPDENAAGAAPCSRSCSTTLQDLKYGDFQSQRLISIPQMQRHIRDHGSIVCSWQLFSNVKPFFRQSKDGVYMGPGRTSAKEEAHAVQVVGYDNDRQAWLVKNSWGPDFAQRGFAWVSFSAPYMCDPEDTWGLIFTPDVPPSVPEPQLTPVAGRKGCYTYTSVAGDYPDRVALQRGVALEQLLEDNLDVLRTDPSTLPPGTRLLLCGSTRAQPAGGGPVTVAPLQLPTAGGSTNQEVGVLMSVKAALDPPGIVLKDWLRDSATPCAWSGVQCDDSNRVTKIFNWDGKSGSPKVQLSGQLPEGSMLARLRALTSIVLVGAKGLTGPLPEDWSLLKQVQNINLSGNRLTGTLPPSWSGMAALKTLDLSANAFNGTLPASWGSLERLTGVYLHTNRLAGPLPPTWGALSKLAKLWLYANKLSGPLPAEWSKLGQLLLLDLSNNTLTGTLAPAWGDLVNLQELTLSRNQLAGRLPASWGTLRWLLKARLDFNRLSGQLPEEWQGMTALQLLWLGHNQFAGTLPDAWRKLAALQTLSVSYCRLTGTLPPSWSALKRLQLLSFPYNRLRGPLPPDWFEMAALNQLWLYRNSLTGTLPSSWRSLPNLGQFFLSYNRLNGTLPASWSRIKGITLMALAGNQLSGTVPPSWGTWRKLEAVTLYANPGLRGCLPPEWSGPLNYKRFVEVGGPYAGKNLLFGKGSGNNITGFC